MSLSIQLPTPKLEPIMQLTVQVSQPVEAGNITHSTGRGKRRIIPIIGGQVTGSARGQSMAGEILPGGADFQLVTSSNSGVLAAQLDARYIIRLTDGSHIYITNQAMRTGSEQDIAALVRGESAPPNASISAALPALKSSAPISLG